MKKVAVFGKPGGGKSTFSRSLATATELPLHQLDKMEYYDGGEKVPEQKYLQSHSEIIDKGSWIIEGFGTIDSFRERLAEADTLVYIDLPYWVHYWWVVKRFLKSPIVKPEGWPKGSPMVRSTLASFSILRKSPMFWSSDFVKNLNAFSATKSVFHITSVKELNDFVEKHVKNG